MKIGIEAKINLENEQVSINYVEGTDITKFNHALMVALNELIVNYPQYSAPVEQILDYYGVDKNEVKRNDIESDYIVDFNVVASGIISYLSDNDKVLPPTGMTFDLFLREINQDDEFIKLNTRSRFDINISFYNEEQKKDIIVFSEILKTVYNTYIVNYANILMKNVTGEITVEVLIENLMTLLEKEDSYITDDKFTETESFIYANLLTALEEFGLQITPEDRNLVLEVLNEV